MNSIENPLKIYYNKTGLFQQALPVPLAGRFMGRFEFPFNELT